MCKFVYGRKSSSMGIIYQQDDLFSDRWDSSEIHTKAKTDTMKKGMKAGWGFTAEAEKGKHHISSLSVPHSLSGPFLVFVRLQRQEHLSPGCEQYLVSEGMCHLCQSCVSLCECACTSFMCVYDWVVRGEGNGSSRHIVSLNAPQLHGGPFKTQQLTWSVWSHRLSGYLMKSECQTWRLSLWCLITDVAYRGVNMYAFLFIDDPYLILWYRLMTPMWHDIRFSNNFQTSSFSSACPEYGMPVGIKSVHTVILRKASVKRNPLKSHLEFAKSHKEDKGKNWKKMLWSDKRLLLAYMQIKLPWTHDPMKHGGGSIMQCATTLQHYAMAF